MRVHFRGDGLLARARLRVVELLDEEHDGAGDHDGDAAGREQALALAARGLVDDFLLHAEARLRGDLREVVFGAGGSGVQAGKLAAVRRRGSSASAAWVASAAPARACAGVAARDGARLRVARAAVAVHAAAAARAAAVRARAAPRARWRSGRWRTCAATPRGAAAAAGTAASGAGGRGGIGARGMVPVGGNAALVEHHAFDGAVGLVVRSAGDLRDGQPQLFEIDGVVDRPLHLERREARA